MSVTAVPLRPIRKGSVLKLWLGLILLALLAAGVAWAGTASQIYQRTASGLQYKVVEAGEGASPTATDVALVTYTGRLADGTVFDTNEGGQPTPMAIGEVVKGFSEGLQLMRKGARYQFRIPPDLGYGPQAQGPIPANATLDFDVKLVDFIPEATVRQMMMQQQMMQMQGGAEGGAPPPPPGGGR